jgi:hypothetical protein
MAYQKFSDFAKEDRHLEGPKKRIDEVLNLEILITCSVSHVIIFPPTIPASPIPRGPALHEGRYHRCQKFLSLSFS